MKLIALMLARNEQWCIGASLRQALRWCDGAVVYLDRCNDATEQIVWSLLAVNGVVKPNCSIIKDSEPEPHWNEMDKRQLTLLRGRRVGGTHFAIVDADEILTSNLLPSIRGFFERLQPGEILNLPMYAVWNDQYQYREDRSVWSRVRITTGFVDSPELAWGVREDGYQHHARPPKGSRAVDASEPFPLGRDKGGVFHLQFANKRRLHAKHVLYRMVDHIRWPGRRVVSELNRIYSEAENTDGLALENTPNAWLEGIGAVNFNEQHPWQEEEIRNLLSKHGRTAFAGLDLGGY